MLAVGGAHGDHARFGVGNDRCRLPKTCWGRRRLGRYRRRTCRAGRRDCRCRCNRCNRCSSALRPFGQYLVGFAQQVTDVLRQRLPELVVGRVRQRTAGAIPPRGPATTDAGAGTDGAACLARHIGVVHPVVAQHRRVGHDEQVAPFHLVAHVHLQCGAIENFGQCLVNGVDADGARQIRVHVQVETGIAGNGKQQVADIDVVHADRKLLGLCAPGAGLWRQKRRIHQSGRHSRRSGARTQVTGARCRRCDGTTRQHQRQADHGHRPSQVYAQQIRQRRRGEKTVHVGARSG